MPNQDIGSFSEQGRGVPVTLSRPQGALPMSPVTRQAYAPQPYARLGWGQGTIAVADVAWEPAQTVTSADTLATVAAYMLRDESDFVPVVDEGRFRGVVYLEAVLAAVADAKSPREVARVLSTQIPTCAPTSALVDAVRQMVACYLRRIPVVGEAGELCGLVTLSEATAAGARDPAVAEVIERQCSTPSFYARRWR